MEVRIVHEGGYKKEYFPVKHYDLSLTAVNHTMSRFISIPRRKSILEETCKIYHNKLLLLDLRRHIRPGESNIKELSALTQLSQLNLIYMENCMNKLKEYCRGPVEFLAAEPELFNAMEDSWCYETTNFIDGERDFVQAYNRTYLSTVTTEEINANMSFIIDSVEQDWLTAFYSDPSFEDLIKEGFWKLRLTPHYQSRIH